jgi:hypothetical protein
VARASAGLCPHQREGANVRSAVARASASTSASGANARSAGARARSGQSDGAARRAGGEGYVCARACPVMRRRRRGGQAARCVCVCACACACASCACVRACVGVGVYVCSSSGGGSPGAEPRSPEVCASRHRTRFSGRIAGPRGSASSTKTSATVLKHVCTRALTDHR